MDIGAFGKTFYPDYIYIIMTGSTPTVSHGYRKVGDAPIQMFAGEQDLTFTATNQISEAGHYEKFFLAYVHVPPELLQLCFTN